MSSIHKSNQHPISANPRCALLHSEWSYIDKPSSEEFRAADWELLNRQRGPYYAEQQAKQALRLLTCGQDDSSFGYKINNYEHCLQSATMVMQAGYDEETIVVALLHDIGFIACPETHGQFAATLLAPYVSEKNYWMLVHHADFQNYHCHEYPGMDRNKRERWRDHPHFEWTAEFVGKYDQNAIKADYDNASLDVFEPMVQRLFSRPPRSLNIDID